MPQEGRVVAAFDESPASSAAMEWAIGMARRLHAPVTVLHVWDPAALWTRLEPADLPAGPDLGRAAHIGRVAGALASSARDARMLVVGTHTDADPAPAPIGSVAGTVAADAHCPVVLVGERALGLPGPGRPVVTAADGSVAATDEAVAVAGLAARIRAPLVVVVRAPDPGEAAVIAQQVRAAVVVAQPDLDLTVEDACGLTSAARSWRAGLLVAGSRAQDTLAGLLEGCDCAVMVLPRG